MCCLQTDRRPVLPLARPMHDKSPHSHRTISLGNQLQRVFAVGEPFGQHVAVFAGRIDARPRLPYVEAQGKYSPLDLGTRRRRELDGPHKARVQEPLGFQRDPPGIGDESAARAASAIRAGDRPLQVVLDGEVARFPVARLGGRDPRVRQRPILSHRVCAPLHSQDLRPAATGRRRTPGRRVGPAPLRRHPPINQHPALPGLSSVTGMPIMSTFGTWRRCSPGRGRPGGG